VDEPRVAKPKVDAVRKFLESADKVLVCTHATFRFAVEELGVQAFDKCLIAIDEFHYVSSNPDNKLGSQLGAFIVRDKVHLVADVTVVATPWQPYRLPSTEAAMPLADVNPY
jgi:hypothetical protein